MATGLIIRTPDLYSRGTLNNPVMGQLSISVQGTGTPIFLTPGEPLTVRANAIKNKSLVLSVENRRPPLSFQNVFLCSLQMYTDLFSD